MLCSSTCSIDRVLLIGKQLLMYVDVRVLCSARAGVHGVDQPPPREGRLVAARRGARERLARRHTARAHRRAHQCAPLRPTVHIARQRHTSLAVFIRVVIVMLFQYSDWISSQRWIRLNVQYSMCCVCSFNWSSEALSEKLGGLQHNNVNVHRFSKAL